jgi:hypothetical protein
MAEVSQYLIEGVKNVVGVPDCIKGITKTRNWILKNSEDEFIVMVDDDVKVAGWTKLYDHRSKMIPMTEAEFKREFILLFDICADLGYKIWGAKTESELRGVFPWKPILFRSYVTASCMGIINDGEYLFDESFPVKEDYEICLRHIKEKGGILCARYFHWVNSHWVDDGGCKSYRTQEIERAAIKKLIKLYPGYIKQVTRGGSEYSIDLNF